MVAASRLDALDDLGVAYRRPAVPVPVPDAELERLIEHLTAGTSRDVEISRGDGDATSVATDVRDLANQPPVVRYVNLLIRDAYDARASDVHLESTSAGLDVRFRLDGVLVAARGPDAALSNAVVSRLKLLADLDIAERRRPQDGRIRVRLESRELDLRVSTVPTMHGESVVLRLLDRGGRPIRLSELGMPDSLKARFEAIARRPHGLVLVTGPTGSGKTTTLYAALSLRDTGREKVITVEDPIEYQLAGITQMPVHRQAGVTFGAALRSILRQDPDVVMIGEMRDRETAEIAIQAAMTGHLVFSTLHTNDAVSAIPRLLDLGIPDYLLSATLEGVLAQRLVRCVCDECREDYAPAEETRAALGVEAAATLRFVRGAGCAACRGTGYRGRVGLFELVAVGDELRAAVGRGATRQEVWALARGSGTRSLREDGWLKVVAGVTTVEEVLRVVQC